MKKPVVKVSITRINDDYSYIILTKLSNKIKVENSFGENILYFENSRVFYKIRNDIDFNKPFIINNSEIEKFKKTFDEINERFGIKVRWRADKEKEYFVVNPLCKIIKLREENTSIDDEYYNSGNYFKTKEEANVLVEMFKEALKLIKDKK